MHTITAMFDTREAAERAREALVDRVGLDRAHIGLHAADADTTQRAEPRHEQKGFLDSLAELFMPDTDRDTYAEGLRRGGFLVSAQVEDRTHDAAVAVLEQHGAVDLDAREQAWRSEGWSGRQRDAAGAPPAQGDRPAADRSAARSGGEQTIPLAEENLKVGKRSVDRGSVRVRSYVVETPVEQQVRLREEHLDVSRRPADRPAGGDDAFRDRVVEVRETDEVPVVKKEARVNEEVVVGKRAEERTKTVRDTVRHTEVEVEDESRRAKAGPKPGANPERR